MHTRTVYTKSSVTIFFSISGVLLMKFVPFFLEFDNNITKKKLYYCMCISPSFDQRIVMASICACILPFIFWCILIWSSVCCLQVHWTLNRKKIKHISKSNSSSLLCVSNVQSTTNILFGEVKQNKMNFLWIDQKLQAICRFFSHSKINIMKIFEFFHSCRQNYPLCHIKRNHHMDVKKQKNNAHCTLSI